MEESERTVKCAISDTIEIKDFSEELATLPHIKEYIAMLHDQVKSQQTCISELKDKLLIYDKEIKSSEKEFVDKDIQTDPVELKEESLPQEWIMDSDQCAPSLVDQVKEAAESAMLQTGFVYEQTTGLYYHYNSGYYYDAKSSLYYNGNTGTYYYYDKESKSYKFHSQIQKESKDTLPCMEEKGKKSSKKKKDRVKKAKLEEGEKDEGELTESDEDEDDSTNLKENDSTSALSNDSETEMDEDVAKEYPPCMRIIVKETNLSNLKVGALFIVTYTGGSLGREGEAHSVIIPDINISKFHAKIQYNEEKKLYEIIDLGSRNGTFLNGKRLSPAKQESNPTEIVHGSILQLGSTKLLCHIHNGHNTCGHCEPGLLQTENLVEENPISIKTQHQSELKRLKCKFGVDDNVNSASRVAIGYQDRAKSRRAYVGSSSQFLKTEQSSLNESISKDNMGFKMLSKMGWSEGTSLGKSGDGVTEPVPLLQNVGKAGLGVSDGIHNVEIDSSAEKKQAIWRKTQQRFNDISK